MHGDLITVAPAERSALHVRSIGGEWRQKVHYDNLNIFLNFKIHNYINFLYNNYSKFLLYTYIIIIIIYYIIIYIILKQTSQLVQSQQTTGAGRLCKHLRKSWSSSTDGTRDLIPEEGSLDFFL